MYTHRTMWRGIEILARRKRWSLAKLATRAGLDPTSLNPSKRVSRDGKARWLSTETLAKLLSAAEMGFGEFCRIVEPLARDEDETERQILVVDNGLGLCAAAAGSLQQMGHTVRVLSAPGEALDILDGDDPVALLCSEMLLPDGWAGATRMQQLATARRPELEVVHFCRCSSSGAPGAHLLLCRPLGERALIDEIARALQGVSLLMPQGW